MIFHQPFGRRITSILVTSEDRLHAANIAVAVLEQKISVLVEEFEREHCPIQCNILTRYRSFEDKYNIKKGGSVQIKLHDRACAAIHPDISITEFIKDPIYKIEYAEGCD